MGRCNFWLLIVAVERVQTFLCCPGVEAQPSPDTSSLFLPARWPAAAPRGPAPSPTPTLPPAQTTSEGRAGKEGSCRGEGAAAAPHSRGSSTGPGNIPRCCSAPRRGQRESDGSEAAGFMHMTELDEQRWRAGGRVPHTPRSPHSLGFATLCRGWRTELVLPLRSPRGSNGSFCGVILYLYLRGVGAGLSSAGWQVLGRGYIYHSLNKRIGGSHVSPGLRRGVAGGFLWDGDSPDVAVTHTGVGLGGGSRFPSQAILGLVLGVSPCPCMPLDVTYSARLYPSHPPAL